MSFAVARAQDTLLLDAFEVQNRIPRTVPILIDSFAIVRTDPSLPFDPAKFRLTRCDGGAEVPFYLEPWTPGADSVMCWVRITNAPASRSVILLLHHVNSINASKSRGESVFLTFQDSIRPTSTQGPSGPWAPWQGAPPNFDRGIIIDARITALRSGAAAYFCYFGSNKEGSDGFVIEHDARLGNQTPDHLRVTPAAVTPILNPTGQSYFEWAPNEPVRYRIELTQSENIISRVSELDTSRKHFARVQRDTALKFVMHGVAAFPGASSEQTQVSFIRTRPIYEFRPRSSRVGASIVPSPLEAMICNGEPVFLTVPNTVVNGGWRTFRWSTGDSTRSIRVTRPGTYWVTVSLGNSCSIRLPSVVVRVDSLPNAGNDTTITLCLGRRETLRVRPGFASYEWFISSGTKRTRLPISGPEAQIDSADDYRCLARTAGGCVDTVRFIVNRIYDTTAKINFPFNDPVLCTGDSIVLRAEPPQSADYTWLRNGVQLPQRGNSLVVRDSGTYTLLVRIGNTTEGCLSVSSIKVRASVKDTFRFQPRTTFCEGDSVTLDAGTFPQVEWWSLSNGSRRLITQFSRGITLKSSDTIQCIGSQSGACKDTMMGIVEMLPAPKFRMSTKEGKNSMCIGEIFTLQSNAAGLRYRWRVWGQDINKDSASIQITLPGLYYVTVDYPSGCSRTDSLLINDGLAPPDLVAPSGQALCPGDSLPITTMGRFTSYEWNTGATSDTIWVKDTGIYSVKVRLFGCESMADIRIEWYDQEGPSISYVDSLTICSASPTFWMTLKNRQRVPRRYNIRVLDSLMHTPRQPVVAVRPQDTASVAFEVDSIRSKERFVTWKVLLWDDCEWRDTLTITIENREKVVPLQIAISSVTPSVRAGDDLIVRLRGPNADGLRDFRNRDTLWVETSVPPDLFEIISASATCRDREIAIQEPQGRVRYALTGCDNGTTEPLVEQRLSVLVGETLSGFFRVDSIYSNSPCITSPLDQRETAIDLLPFGCELSTIARSNSLIVGVGSMSDGIVSTSVSQSNGPVTVRIVDVLGRIIDSNTVPSGDGLRQCLLRFGSDNIFYLVATDDTSMVTIPLAGMNR